MAGSVWDKKMKRPDLLERRRIDPARQGHTTLQATFSHNKAWSLAGFLAIK